MIIKRIARLAIEIVVEAARGALMLIDYMVNITATERGVRIHTAVSLPDKINTWEVATDTTQAVIGAQRPLGGREGGLGSEPRRQP